MSLKVYKASAGSGKTFQLALEYISLALREESPLTFSQILAVTFTNKATAEMKDRILAQLYNLAHGQQDRTFFEELKKLLPDLSVRDIEIRAARTLRAIIHNYDRFRVETIDSFFQSLLTNLAHELNLSRTFRINLDQDEVISQAVDRLLITLRTSQNDNVSRIILHYMEEQIDDNKGWNISNSLKSFSGQNLFNETYLKNEENLNQELSDIQKIGRLKHTIHTRRQELKEPLHQHAIQLLDLLENGHSTAHPQSLKSIKALLKFTYSILADDYSADIPVTLVKATNDWKPLLKKELQKDADYQELAQKVSEHLSAIIPPYEENRVFMNTSELVLQKITPLILLNTIGREVNALSRETGSFLLAKTPDLFNKMVKQEDASFVFERNGITFRHIMIDEFQDTSGNQWKNFKNLLIENLAQGDECMLVGDIKQSIYRWRGGNWKILGNIENEMKYLGKVDIRALENNFRSQLQIIDFNNRLFESIARKYQDAPNHYDIISHIYQDVRQNGNPSANKGYVRAAMIDRKADKEDVMDDLCQQILFLHDEKHIPFDQMGILVRRNKEAVSIIEYIAGHYPQIPVTSDEAFRLSASPCVMLLVNTLKALSAPDNTVARELVSRYLLTIQQYAASGPMPDPEILYNDRERLIHMPLFELCYQLTGFYGMPLAEQHGLGQSAFLYSFMDNVRSFIDENSSSLSGFVEYWDNCLCKKFITVNVRDSVYIMTIHKSKGLQRHTILIPFCDWVMDKDYPDDTIWCNTSHLAEPFNRFPLLPIATYSSTKVRNSEFKEPYELEHLEQTIDSINELYVALTRAECNLLLWSQESTRPNQVHTLLQHFFTTETEPGQASWDIHTYGEPHDYVAKSHKLLDNPLETDHAVQLDQHLSASSPHTEFKQSNKALDFVATIHEADTGNQDDTGAESAERTKDRQYYIDRGKLLHRLFSLIHSSDDIDQAISTLAHEGVIDYKREHDTLYRFITKRIGNPKVSPWFDGSWTLFTECNILTRNADHKVIQYRPDRVMQKGDTTIILDYKFGNFDDSYIAQVQNYMKALQQMGYKHIEGYLWFVYKDQVVEVSWP